MNQDQWGNELNPPEGGFRKLQLKIAAKETEKRHFRFAVFTLVIAVFYLAPEGYDFGHYLNPFQRDKAMNAPSLYQKLSEAFVPGSLSGGHKVLMKEIEAEWHEKQRLKPARVVYEGEHFIQIVVSEEMPAESMSVP